MKYSPTRLAEYMKKKDMDGDNNLVGIRPENIRLITNTFFKVILDKTCELKNVEIRDFATVKTINNDGSVRRSRDTWQFVKSFKKKVNDGVIPMLEEQRKKRGMR